MPRTIIEAERVLPYAPDALCKLVGDVRVYPEFEPAKGEVEVALVKGPLHSLANKWWFKPHENGAHVRYWIAYEFKNPVLQAAISANKDKLASRIMAAFEREAKRRLG